MGSELTIPQRVGNPIAEVVLDEAAATIDFQNIPQTFRNLRVVFSLRGDAAAAAINLGVRFNGDAEANYDYHLGGMSNNTNATPVPGVAQTAMLPVQAPAASATANKFGNGELLIPDYTSTLKHKGLTGDAQTYTSEAAAGIVTRRGSGLWRSTAAINRITLLDAAGGNFAAGSVATLYGEGRAPLG